jgi:hypothetical protein
VLPRINDDVNEEWISDKGRYQVEGLTRRRLDRPWIRRDGKLAPASWDEAFAAVARVNPGAKFFTSVAGLGSSIWLRFTEHGLTKRMRHETSVMCQLLERGLLYVSPQRLAVELMRMAEHAVRKRNCLRRMLLSTN